MDYNPDPGNDNAVFTQREIDNFPINIFLDPSMFADTSIESTTMMIRDLSGSELSFYTSKTFYDILEYAVEHEGQLQYSGDQHTLDYFTTYSEIESIYDTSQSLLDSNLSTFDPIEFYEDGMLEIYQMYYDSLPAPEVYDDYESPYAPRGYRLADIYFEELMFGILRSPILSRLKRTASDLKNGTDYLVELSDSFLDNISNEIERGVSAGQSYRDALYEELEELERQSRNRQNQGSDAPVRKIAILREIVKSYPDTNYINYVVKSVPPGLGAAAGSSIQGPMGAAAGATAGRFIGLYFADP